MRRSHAAALIRLVCIILAITLWGGGPAADGAAGVLAVAATVVSPGRLRRALAAAEMGDPVGRRSDVLGDAFHTGFALVQEGQLEAAVPHLQRAAEENARDADALFHLAGALAGLDRLDEADVAYARAVLLRPRDALFRLGRGALLARLGRRDAAVAELRQALALRPQLLAARQLLERVENGIPPVRRSVGAEPIELRCA